jgi:glucokinase
MRTPVVLGLDFGGTKIAAAVSDPSGARLGTTTVDTRADLGAQATLGQGIRAARALLTSAVPDGCVIAVGASTIGVPGVDGVALAPAVPGWDTIPLARELAAAFPGAEVRVATDVKAAAQAEARWGSLIGTDTGVYLNLGTGLAVAIVANGTVLAGQHGASGEIGYNLRSVADVGVALSDRVPLEDVISGKAFWRAAVRLLPGRSDSALAFERASSDPQLAALIRSFVDELAYHVVNLAIAIDPSRIAVGGGMVRSWRHIEGGLRRALDAAVPYPPDLVRATFPYDAPLMGALALGTDAARKRLAVTHLGASPEVSAQSSTYYDAMSPPCAPPPTGQEGLSG